MVDTSEAAESNYVNAELIDKSASKVGVIVGDAEYEETKFGKKLTVPIEIDFKKKTYRPNKDSAAALNKAFGTDSKSWLGKRIVFKTVKVMGKDSVLASPLEVKA